MNEQLVAFIKNLIYWLEQEHALLATVKSSGDNKCELSIVDEEGETFWVGNYAEDGALVRWIGETKLEGLAEPVDLIHINGIVIQALGRHVAGWIAGYS
jgi:hypothetical protein